MFWSTGICAGRRRGLGDRIISICKVSNRGSQITEPFLFTSTCPLKVQISQGLGSFFQIALKLWPYTLGGWEVSEGRTFFIEPPTNQATNTTQQQNCEYQKIKLSNQETPNSLDASGRLTSE